MNTDYQSVTDATRAAAEHRFCERLSDSQLSAFISSGMDAHHLALLRDAAYRLLARNGIPVPIIGR